jgi:hypothetical protein
MLTPLLLLACAPEPKPDDEAAPPLEPTPHCVEEELEPDTLDWSDPGAGGFSAADVFGFAVGAHTATLTWDDGTTTDATFTVTPVSAIQQRTGEGEACPVGITGLADWEIHTADGRLSLAGSAEWRVTDASLPAGGVLVYETLTDADLTLAKLNPASVRRVRLFLGDANVLLNLQVDETWPLGTDSSRLCVRGTLDPSTIECQDTTDNPGPD